MTPFMSNYCTLLNTSWLSFFRKFYHGKKAKSQEEILQIVNNDIQVEEKHGQTMYFT